MRRLKPYCICLFPLLPVVLFLLWACASSPAIDEPAQALPPEPLVLTFAGDIMAHNVNFNMKDYNTIYDDVRPLLQTDDFSFANFETPVADSLPMSTYPRFNVHHSYLTAAVAGGFNVFSFANNHTNDQGFTGIKDTLQAIRLLPRGTYSNGIRKAAGDPLSPVLIQKKGWTIVFLAVTEILNSHDPSMSQVQYSPPTAAGRKALRLCIEEIAAAHPDSLFILSLHTYEPEYVRTASGSLKKWFAELAESGVDIVWAHHPHVMQEWEVVEVDGRNCLFMYSMGNFISGQRWHLNLDDPAALREYTGDAVLIRVTLDAGAEQGTLVSPVITPVPITNYRDPRHGMIVRLFTPDFIDSLPEKLGAYYRKRYTLMSSYLPLLP